MNTIMNPIKPTINCRICLEPQNCDCLCDTCTESRNRYDARMIVMQLMHKLEDEFESD